MNVIPLFCMDTLPEPNLNACMSLALRNVVMATRKRHFYVRYFKGDKYKGSKGGFLRNFNTNGRSHSGKSFTVGGLELKMPLIYQTI